MVGGACIGVLSFLDGSEGANFNLLPCGANLTCAVAADGDESCVAQVGSDCTSAGEATCSGNQLRVCVGFQDGSFFVEPYAVDCGVFGPGFVCDLAGGTAGGADCVFEPGDETAPVPDTLPFSSTTALAIGDRDCFVFTVDADTTLAVTADSANCATEDTVVQVFQNGVLIGDGDDRSRNSRCSTATVDVLAGDVVVCVEEFERDAALAEVTLTVAVTSATGDDAGGRANAAATALPLQQTVDLAVNGDEDCFRLSLGVVGTFEATTSGAAGCPGDTVLSLFDAAGNIVARNDDANGGRCSAFEVDVDAGVYTLCARALFDGDAIAGVAVAAAFGPGLLISEVADPQQPSSGAARFVELKNVTTVDAAAGAYRLRTFSNGNLTASGTITLTAGGVIPAGGTWIVANDADEFATTFAALLDPAAVPSVGRTGADQQNGSLNGNGNDVYELLDAAGARIDVYGVVGEGATTPAWDYADGAAARNDDVVAPSATFDASQWTVVKAPAQPSFTPGR
ncbi:MAG: lamin tail domain-containing protein [Deltaproteobacteria bacterium]|nr:lamin tail domain-containing protein [Deltaproteobacteria bacterium]